LPICTFAYLHIRGRVVIGEGERDEAPMLFIGEEVGDGAADAPEIDIAVDPLEGTNLCANGINDALAVVAMAEHGQFLNAPDTYMNKIAVGAIAKGAVHLPGSAHQQPPAGHPRGARPPPGAAPPITWRRSPRPSARGSPI